jgi:hypothetical protein
MKCKRSLQLCLIVFLALTFLNLAHALTAHLPFPTNIPSGLKVHFGDYWINASGRTVHITAWFVNNWTNYTVTGSGIQQIYNGTKPSSVYINGVNTSEGAGWTYSSGTVTITTATSSAWLLWGTAIPSPTILNLSGLINILTTIADSGLGITRATTTCSFSGLINILTTIADSVNWRLPSPPPSNETWGNMFVVTFLIVNREQIVKGATVTVGQQTQKTDQNGKAKFMMQYGEYNVTIEYKEKTVTRKMLISVSETITIDINDPDLIMQPAMPYYLLILAPVLIALALLKKGKKR